MIPYGNEYFNLPEAPWLGFSVKYYYDTDAEPPWEGEDGHGPVRHGRPKDKRPGERALGRPDRLGYCYLYDWQKAVKTARQDNWCSDLPGTPGQRAAAAVQRDFEYLSGWVNDDWCYVGVIVTAIDESTGRPLDEVLNLWRVETDKDYHRMLAREEAEAWVKDRDKARRDAWRSALHEARERRFWAFRGVVTA